MLCLVEEIHRRALTSRVICRPSSIDLSQALVAARQTMTTAGVQLAFLPPLSPDFNPIENAFAKLNAILRKVAAHTVEEP